MSESTMKATLIRKLRAEHAIAVENAARAGTSDVNYVEGWIECKYKPKWPVRPETPLTVPTFTPQQRTLMLKRARAGGRIHLLLKVGQEWFLMGPVWAALRLGQATQAEIRQHALGHWKRSLVADELRQLLNGGKLPARALKNSPGASDFGLNAFDAKKINTRRRYVSA